MNLRQKYKKLKRENELLKQLTVLFVKTNDNSEYITLGIKRDWPDWEKEVLTKEYIEEYMTEEIAQIMRPYITFEYEEGLVKDHLTARGYIQVKKKG